MTVKNRELKYLVLILTIILVYYETLKKVSFVLDTNFKNPTNELQ